MKIINTIYLLLFCLLLVLVPFIDLGEAITNLFILGLAILFPFVIKKKHLIFLKQNKGVICIISLACIILLEIIIFKRWEDLKVSSKLWLFIAFYILSIPLLDRKEIKKLMLSFLFGVFVLFISSLVLIVKGYLLDDNFNIAVGDVNSFLLGDRPYMGFMYLIGIFTSFFLVTVTKNKPLRYLLFLFSFSLVLFLFFISARASMLSLFIAILTAIFYIKDRRIKLITIGSFTAICFTMLYFNNNFKERLTLGFKEDNVTLNKILRFEPRYYIWNCVYKITTNSSPKFTGLGFENTQEKLNSCFLAGENFNNQEHKQWFLDKKFNTHNQYFNFYLGSGIIGLISMLFFSFTTLIDNRHSLFAFVINLSMLLFFVFENVLTRQMGVVLCAIVLIFSKGIKLLTSEKKSHLEPTP
ncbi:O-antigen ligase family protein [Pseudotamlana agarivorans]|uniref:O-antigen ligase family protein n=1 Tax=Pseudotamlana agarivorans TaxID=481183 RepID=UPI00082F7486|nr:O-antigen ligase family protein [Tamlana agarivorans]